LGGCVPAIYVFSHDAGAKGVDVLATAAHGGWRVMGSGK
jgi:hypothetical protein